MSSKPKASARVEAKRPSLEVAGRTFGDQLGASRKSDVAHTRFISSAVKNPAVIWRIGSKPNVNSQATRSLPQVSRRSILIKQQRNKT